MIVANIILTFLLGLIIFLAGAWTIKSRRSFKANQKVANDLEGIIANTLDVVKKSRELHLKQSKPLDAYTYVNDVDGMDLNSPEVLSTLITVLVSKYGDVKLSMQDFVVDDTEYISIYVDTATQEIILSKNHNLVEDLDRAMVKYTKSDDTYH